jgi:hypothetical protein
MKELLLEMKAEVERAKALGQHELDALLLAHLLRRYDSILAEGYQANPPPAASRKSEQSKRTPGRAKQSPARNLLDRLSGSKWAVLRFLLDFAVPFDNNQAERDLRMIPRAAKGLRVFPYRRWGGDVLSHPQLPVDPAQARDPTALCTWSHPCWSSRSSRFFMTLLNSSRKCAGKQFVICAWKHFDFSKW